MGIIRKLMRLGIPAAGLAALAVAGCATATWGHRSKHTRTLDLMLPFEGEGTFAARTHNGSIYVAGGETEACAVVATIETEASSEAEALELSDRVSVRLERSAGGVDVKIEKPETGKNQVIRVHLKATVPSGMSVRFGSHNGSVGVAHVAAAHGSTHNGPIKITSVRGALDVHSHNGAIRAEEIVGPSKMRTHNGKVVARLSEADPTECVVRTHNGRIDLEAPDRFSGRVSVRSHNGAIHSDFPITVSGKIRKGHLEGTVGSGNGLLDLQAHNGSIHIHQTVR